MDIMTAVIAAPDMPTPNVNPNSWIICFPDSEFGGLFMEDSPIGLSPFERNVILRRERHNQGIVLLCIDTQVRECQGLRAIRDIPPLILIPITQPTIKGIHRSTSITSNGYSARPIIDNEYPGHLAIREFGSPNVLNCKNHAFPSIS